MKILVTGGSGFIGTNYIEFLVRNGQDPLDSKYLTGQAEIINLDHSLPRNPAHKKFWRECDLLDAFRLKKIIKDFSPTHVVHLAAKTGTYLKKLTDFAANMEGVQNLISALKQVSSLERVIFTSSLLVCKMGYVPRHDTDYSPSTAYGLSKVKMEQIIRAEKDLPFSWIIIRPISIWGPWFGEPYKNFFKAIKQGWYFHIGSGHYKRSLGYVENTVYEIHKLLLAPREKVDRKTFYVADEEPVDLYDMANIIREITGAPRIRHIPLWMAKVAAKIGDFCKILGWHSVPLSSFRLNNIRTEYVFDMKSLIEITGHLPYTLKEGIERTVEWMCEIGEI